MKRRALTALAILVGLVVTGLLVAASIWPVIDVVETGKTPEYPQIRPQYYTAEPRRVFEQSRGAIESMENWTLVSDDPNTQTITATRETSILGFVHDVEVWIEPVTEFVTRVRVRSASRMSKGDFGQNARNIRELFRALDERLGAVKFDPDRLDEERQPSNNQPDAGETDVQ